MTIICIGANLAEHEGEGRGSPVRVIILLHKTLTVSPQVKVRPSELVSAVSSALRVAKPPVAGSPRREIFAVGQERGIQKRALSLAS